MSLGDAGSMSWVPFCAVSALAPGAWVTAALQMGHREDLGLVVLVGVMLVGS